MADIQKISFDDTVYDIKDADAREMAAYYYITDEDNGITYRCYDAIVDGKPVTYYEEWTAS